MKNHPRNFGTRGLAGAVDVCDLDYAFRARLAGCPESFVVVEPKGTEPGSRFSINHYSRELSEESFVLLASHALAAAGLTPGSLLRIGPLTEKSDAGTWATFNADPDSDPATTPVGRAIAGVLEVLGLACSPMAWTSEYHGKLEISLVVLLRA